MNLEFKGSYLLYICIRTKLYHNLVFAGGRVNLLEGNVLHHSKTAMASLVSNRSVNL